MNFDKERYAAIVPVRCGKKHGTAFFVSSNQLLTAWHVVSENVRNNVPVYCFYKEQAIECEVKVVSAECDLVMLTTERYAHSVWIDLLALPTEVEKPTALAGYPMEIGLNRDMFDFAIHHAKQVTGREYDVVASPKELIPFRSYKGFSGSPIITDDGLAVGVVTDQLSSVIGYTSIFKTQEELVSEGVPVLTDWEGYDTSAYGYARCKQLTEKQVDSAGDRYSPNEHVDSEDLKREFNVFCNKKEHDRVDFKQASQQAEDWYMHICGKYKFINSRYKQGEFLTLRHYLTDLRSKIQSKDDSLKEYSAFSAAEKDELHKLIARLNEIFHMPQDTSSRCAFVRGMAGSGKTHFLCRLAKEHDYEYQAYLLFGSQFKSGENVQSQVERLLDFPEGFDGLERYMAGKGRYAIIIIDALNEGAGFAYWKGEVNQIPDIVEKYEHVRFILSSRDPIPSDFLSEENRWMVRTTENSIDPEKLRDSYFTKYKIDPKSVGQNIYEFSNPLFLRIFCVSYKMIPVAKRKNITKPDLFWLYIYERNKKIVEAVDEDPYKNVTAAFFRKLANYSLYYSYCNDVSRDKARLYSRQICPGRLWDKSLLNACLKENLLQESFSRDGNPSVEFEFENLGDFMRAFTFLDSKMNAERMSEWLYDQKTWMIKKRMPRTKFTHFVGALLSVGGERTDEFARRALAGKDWDSEFFDALQYRGRYNRAIVAKFLIDGNTKIVSYLIRDVDKYGYDQIEGLHQTLMKLPLPDRDLRWSMKLNELYDWNGREGFLQKRKGYTKEDIKKLAVLETWLLCSSYPELRAIVIRNLVELFVASPEVTIDICKLFCGCDDDYVLEGMYCAAYGMALRLRDVKMISELGKVVYELNYTDASQIPNNLMVRTWTMKILERAHSLNPGFEYWQIVKPPFTLEHNPFDLLNNAGNTNDKDFFGTSNGSHLLHYSLFGESDFNRYVIGTNNAETDRVMVTMNTHEEVRLDDIARMVGVRIKELKWDDRLGRYDDGKYSESRFDNEKERIGKKYQWLAYYDVMGRLTDCCYLRKGRYGEKKNQLYEINYPWYADVRNYFDPALQAVNAESTGVRIEIASDTLTKQPAEWYDDDNKMPAVNLILNDEFGEEWILMCGFDTENQAQRDRNRSQATFVNSAFVRAEDEARITEWAKDQNFYGRWMPEHLDNIDFRWNEYPWADSYRQSLETEPWERPYHCDCPADVMVSYMSQLQEDTRGFDSSKDFRALVFMPCEDMMSKLDLYNAERGVVRMVEDNNIACLDYGMTGGKDRKGMMIRKSVLERYLEATGYTLFWFVLGEKTQSIGTESEMKDLSACWKLKAGQTIEELQKMHVAAKHP